jgi:SP family facilitated glucose transporter-like MFS transporter 1
MNTSHYSMFDKFMTESQVATAWSVTVAIFAVGGMIGGLLSGWLADTWGRKGGMLLNNIVALIAAALMGSAKYAGAYPLLIAGRLVIGFNSGMCNL